MTRIRIPAPGDIQASTTLIAYVIGALYLLGALLACAFLLLPNPSGVQDKPIIALAGLGVLIAAVMFATADKLSGWWLHAAIALASAITCAGIYFAGQPSLAGPLFVWIVLTSAFFFPGRQALAHLTWLFALYAVVVFTVDGTVFAPVTRLLLNFVAFGTTCAVVSWLSSANNRRLQMSIEEARTDALTGLPNRRWLSRELVREFGWAKRHQGRLFAAIIDLDGFKAYNDRHGHLAEDRLLVSAVAGWNEALRASDFLARTGGDEFMVLLHDSTDRLALGVVERVRAKTPAGVTCSAGLTQWDGKEDPLELFARADAALYSAKEDGGDQTVVTGPSADVGKADGGAATMGCNPPDGVAVPPPKPPVRLP